MNREENGALPMRWSKKSDRLLQLEQLLLAHPEGLRRAELARRMGVNRSTVTRDIRSEKHTS